MHTVHERFERLLQHSVLPPPEHDREPRLLPGKAGIGPVLRSQKIGHWLHLWHVQQHHPKQHWSLGHPTSVWHIVPMDWNVRLKCLGCFTYWRIKSCVKIEINWLYTQLFIRKSTTEIHKKYVSPFFPSFFFLLMMMGFLSSLVHFIFGWGVPSALQIWAESI